MDMHWTNRSRNSPFLVLRGAALLRGNLTSARADAQNRDAPWSIERAGAKRSAAAKCVYASQRQRI